MKPNDKNIKDVYNKIAEGFYHTRQQPLTPEIETLAKKWKSGKLLDIGCGPANSTLPFAQAGFSCYACDISPNMLKLAKQYAKKHNVKIKFTVGNILKIQFPKQNFDYVISIAAFHHLDSESKRLRALKEIKKVLKKNGKFFVTVWNNKEKGDKYVPWNHSGKVYQRYYHFFSKSELKDLFKKAGFVTTIYFDEKEKNICIKGTKLQI